MFRILLADDEKMALLASEHSLPFSKHHMTVITKSYDSFEALHLLQNRFYDAAFLDIRMPGLSGLDIIKACQQCSPLPEFIIVSGYSDFSYARQAIQCSVFDYCLKPIQSSDSDLLLDRLEEKLYQNRIQNGPVLLNRFLEMEHQSDFLNACGLTAHESASFTAIAVSVPSCRSLVPLPCLVDTFYPIFLGEQKAILAGMANQMEIDNTIKLLLEIPDCRLAVGSTDFSGGQLKKLLHEIQTDLLLTSSENPVIQTLAGTTNDAFRLLLEEVRTAYTQDLSLASLAQKYNLSYSYCSELFKSATGFTFSKYITQLRMKSAAKLLLSSQLPISDICYQVGYHSYHHFEGTFKNFFGSTPTEYRQKGGVNNAPEA